MAKTDAVTRARGAMLDVAPCAVGLLGVVRKPLSQSLPQPFSGCFLLGGKVEVPGELSEHKACPCLCGSAQPCPQGIQAPANVLEHRQGAGAASAPHQAHTGLGFPLLFPCTALQAQGAGSCR